VIDIGAPVGPRAEGVIFGFFTSNPDVSGYDLGAIKVPTLIIHSKDDPLTSYDTAQRAAIRIPGARLVSAEQGGHLGLGQQTVTSRELAAFLGTPAPAQRGAAPASGPDSARRHPGRRQDCPLRPGLSAHQQPPLGSPRPGTLSL
jgi:pimeloyl-ACP methyl ester carboxylesterase